MNKRLDEISTHNKPIIAKMNDISAKISAGHPDALRLLREAVELAAMLRRP